MERHFWGHVTIGFLVVTGLLVASAVPADAAAASGGFHGGGFPGGGFHHVGFHHGLHHGFHHHPFLFHRPCCFGPRLFVGVGVGVPFVYPYAYPVVYSPPVVVESTPPAYTQPQQQYWYYCQGAQAYYPYVKECPGGWLQVVPQPSPPLQ